MTPSEAHNSAWQREPSHDEMTLACWHKLRRTWKTYKCAGHNKSDILPLKFSGAEQLCAGDGSRSFFADILMRWDFPGGERGYGAYSVFAAFEIKPKIYSAGAVLRQTAVQRARLDAWAKKDEKSYDNRSFVELIVRADDPLLDLTVALANRSVLKWDGKRLLRHYPSNGADE